MGIEFKITGIKEELAKLTKEFTAIQRKERERVAEQLVDELAAATPIDTGRARHGWEVKQVGDITEIVNEVPYIDDLNHGTSRQAPTNFIEQTVLKNKNVKPQGAIVKIVPPSE